MSIYNEKLAASASSWLPSIQNKFSNEYNKVLKYYNETEASKPKTTDVNIAKEDKTASQVKTEQTTTSTSSALAAKVADINLNQSLNLKVRSTTKPLFSNLTDMSVEDKAISLCKSIERASSSLIKSTFVADLFKILYDNPDVRHVIHKKQNNVINSLLKLQENAKLKQDKRLYGNVNECLALLGYVDQNGIKHNGLNILTLDGGGAKGFVAIEVLKNIQKQCGGKPLHEIFDYICGVSTGAVLATLIGVYKLPLDECERQYKLFTKEIFQRNRAAGIGNLIMSYAYYDTQIWETLLKEAMGDTLIINSAKDEKACKISVVSNVTTPNEMKVFLFRNYNLPTSAQSHYDGTTRYKVWEAIRASSAAPGYYEDFKLDGYVFHVNFFRLFF